jgi:hypothetical protein
MFVRSSNRLRAVAAAKPFAFAPSDGVYEQCISFAAKRPNREKNFDISARAIFLSGLGRLMVGFMVSVTARRLS